jgi:two-component sensor histidine kinase
LDSKLATPLAVALTEVVTNAASHGLGEHGGSILITPRQTAKQLSIEVEDNGVGFKKEAIGTGLGTQIIKTLIEGELRGKISWFSPKDGGTKVAISIPI